MFTGLTMVIREVWQFDGKFIFNMHIEILLVRMVTVILSNRAVNNLVGSIDLIVIVIYCNHDLKDTDVIAVSCDVYSSAYTSVIMVYSMLPKVIISLHRLLMTALLKYIAKILSI